MGKHTKTLAKPDRGHLFSARDELVARLNRGTDMIVELKAKGKDASKAEALWLELLQEYTVVEDQISMLAREAIPKSVEGGTDA